MADFAKHLFRRFLLFVVGLAVIVVAVRLGVVFVRQGFVAIDNTIISLLGSFLVPVFIFVISLFVPKLWDKIKEVVTRVLSEEQVREMQELRSIESEFEGSINHIREVFIEVGNLNEIRDDLAALNVLHGAEHVWDYHVYLIPRRPDTSFLENFFEISEGEIVKVKETVDNAFIGAAPYATFLRRAEKIINRPGLRRIPQDFDGLLIKGTIRERQPEFKNLHNLLSLCEASVRPEDRDLNIDLIAFVNSGKRRGCLWFEPKDQGAVEQILRLIADLVDRESMIEITKNRPVTNPVQSARNLEKFVAESAPQPVS